MAGAANRYMVHCTLDGKSDLTGYQMVLIPAGAKGLTIDNVWDPMGMRATVSPGSVFEDCFVTDDALLGGPGDPFRTGVVELFGLGYAAVYLGVARRALDIASDHAKSQKYQGEMETIALQDRIRHHFSEMAVDVFTARTVLDQIAKDWDDAPPEEHALMAARAKYAASTTALRVTSKAMQVVGGRGSLRPRGLERLLRDVRTSTLMPPNEDRCLEIIANAELGTPSVEINDGET